MAADAVPAAATHPPVRQRGSRLARDAGAARRAGKGRLRATSGRLRPRPRLRMGVRVAAHRTGHDPAGRYQNGLRVRAAAAVFPQERDAAAAARRDVHQGHHPQPAVRPGGGRLEGLVRPRPGGRGRPLRRRGAGDGPARDQRAPHARGGARRPGLHARHQGRVLHQPRRGEGPRGRRRRPEKRLLGVRGLLRVGAGPAADGSGTARFVVPGVRRQRHPPQRTAAGGPGAPPARRYRHQRRSRDRHLVESHEGHRPRGRCGAVEGLPGGPHARAVGPCAPADQADPSKTGRAATGHSGGDGPRHNVEGHGPARRPLLVARAVPPQIGAARAGGGRKRRQAHRLHPQPTHRQRRAF
mmetsp:Transcript_22/g.67  ORF Transcript_22/g.67 Transcript_22/m.67 type:complete len:355 (-) Transcript_22:608-1672(-)